MKQSEKGIHHITVLGGDGQRTTDFYVKTLGLRMIMKTVNQDDPATYPTSHGCHDTRDM